MLQVLRETANEYGSHNAPLLAAALAFFSLFSLAPLLLILTSALVFLGATDAIDSVMREIRHLFGADGVELLEDMIEGHTERGGGTLAALLGTGMAIVAGTTLFAQLERALNIVWGVEPELVGTIRSARHLLAQRARSLGLIAIIGALMLLAAFLSTYVSAVLVGLAEQVPGGTTLWQWLNRVGTFAILASVFAIVLTLLPNATVPRLAVLLGAVVTAALFVLGSWAFGIYVSSVAIDSAFGAAGSLVVLLLWVYVSAHAVLLGATFTKVVARRLGDGIERSSAR
jgi:membrane protein